MTDYIKSPMNYTGGKYKLLEYIIPCFPESMNKFVDLFAGGLNVGINVQADAIYANDQITYLIELYRLFQNTPIDLILEKIKDRIALFGLSQTNSEGYYALRAEFNKSKSMIDLFLLTCYSFNHQIRFNSRHEFNISFGKERSSFNNSIKTNLMQFCTALQNKKIILSAADFRDFDFTLLTKGDVVYCDPPYLLTTAPYNDGKCGFKNWTEKDDSELMSLLDKLNERGVLFTMSNVFVHKGQINDALIEWSKKYKVIKLNKNYSNCSYHLKDRKAKTVEVLITNQVCQIENKLL